MHFYRQESQIEAEMEETKHKYTQMGKEGYADMLLLYQKAVNAKKAQVEAAKKAVDDSSKEIAEMKSIIASMKASSAVCPSLPSFETPNQRTAPVAPQANRTRGNGRVAVPADDLAVLQETVQVDRDVSESEVADAAEQEANEE